MTQIEFDQIFEDAVERSRKILCVKASEYADEGNRLKNFHQSASVQCIPATQACVGMMTKHYASVCDMAKNPSNYSIDQWNEKLGDLRNYTFLLEALLYERSEQCKSSMPLLKSDY